MKLKFQNDEAEIERMRAIADVTEFKKGSAKQGSPAKNVHRTLNQTPCKMSLSEIRPLLNGYGRIVEYDILYQVSDDAATTTFADASACSIKAIYEGKFKMGKLDSYGRVFSVHGDEKVCMVGFFTAGDLDGKGEVFNNHSVTSGIYIGGHLQKTMEVHNYQTRQITNNTSTVDHATKTRNNSSVRKIMDGYENKRLTA